MSSMVIEKVPATKSDMRLINRIADISEAMAREITTRDYSGWITKLNIELLESRLPRIKNADHKATCQKTIRMLKAQNVGEQIKQPIHERKRFMEGRC